MSRGRTGRAGKRGASSETDSQQTQRRARGQRRGAGQPGGRRGAIQPDALDLQIISLLRDDGRRSNREVARRIGVPEATVRYRVRRLTDSGILKIAASVDPEHLGYALTAVISVQVEPRRFVEVADAMSDMPEVMWLAITSGASDIVLTASFRTQDEMFSFIADRIAHIEGINRIETSVCMRVVKKSNQWATDLTTAIAPSSDLGGEFADADDEDEASPDDETPATARRRRGRQPASAA